MSRKRLFILFLTILCSLTLSCRVMHKKRIITELNEESRARRASNVRRKLLPDRGARLEPEFRGVWMSRFNYDSPEDIKKAVKNLEDYHFNALVFQVRGNGACYYESQMEPWAIELGGKHPGWDPLATAIEEAHKADIQLHAWINILPGWQGTNPPKTANQLWHTHRDWFMVPISRRGRLPRLEQGYTFLNPCLPEVRAYLVELVVELAQKYDVDGVHFDFIRFPGPEYTYDKKTLEAFESRYGKTPEEAPGLWSDFRRNAVNTLLSQCNDALHQVRPELVVSVAARANFQENFTHFYQDARLWLNKGLTDASLAMIYRVSPDTFLRFASDHVWNNHQRAVYPGIGSHMIKDARILLEQVKICRDLHTGGMIFFDYASLFEDHLPSQKADELLRGPFREAVPPHPLPWLKITDNDQTGPNIAEVKIEPRNLKPGDSFHVSCRITDPSGIHDSPGGSYEKGVYLLYDFQPSLSAGKEAPISMDKGDTYKTDSKITAPEAGKTLFLRVYAWDNDKDVEEGGADDQALGTSDLHRIYVPFKTKTYRFDGNFGNPECGLQYPAMDARERLWVCSMSKQTLLIYNPDGIPSSLSPIRTALDDEGNPHPILNPSGLAIDTKRHIAYVSSGNKIFRFNTKNGKPLPAFKTQMRLCGDIAVDNQGNLYVTNRIRRRWMLYDPAGQPLVPYETSPYSPDHSFYNNPALTRGITITPNGEIVYVICEDEGVVDIYRREKTDSPQYRHEGILTHDISLQSAAVDISPDGRLFVSEGSGVVKVFTPDGKHNEDITYADGELNSPRGVAFSRDGSVLYIVHTGDFESRAPIQKWIKTKTQKGAK